MHSIEKVKTVKIINKHNPFNQLELSTTEATVGTKFIDWLLEKHPKGFEKPTTVYRNQKKVEVADFDFVIGEHDVIVLTYDVGEKAIQDIGQLVIDIVTTAYEAVQDFVYWLGDISRNTLELSSKPSTAKTGQPKQTTAYGLRAQSNFPRLGEPIPSRYGRFRCYPDLAARPYLKYSRNITKTWNTFGEVVTDSGTGDEENLFQVFCLGHGQYDISDFRLIDMSVERILGFDYTVYEPGNPVTTFEDNIYTLPIGNNIEVKQRGRYLRESPSSFTVGSDTGTSSYVRLTNISGTNQQFKEFIEIGDLLIIDCELTSVPANTADRLAFYVQGVDAGEVKEVFDDYIVLEYPVDATTYNTISLTNAVVYNKQYYNIYTAGTFMFNRQGINKPSLNPNYGSTERYLTSPPYTEGLSFEFDFEFRRGLYNFVDPNYETEAANFKIYFKAINEDNTLKYLEDTTNKRALEYYEDASTGAINTYYYYINKSNDPGIVLNDGELKLYDRVLGVDTLLITYKGDWETGKSYILDDQVAPGYSCIVPHVSSGSFPADLALGYWDLTINVKGFSIVAFSSFGTPEGGWTCAISAIGLAAKDLRLTANVQNYLVYEQSYDLSFSAASPEVKRFTYTFDALDPNIIASGALRYGRYEIIIERNDEYDWNDTNRQDSCLITRIKTKLPNVENYGPYTMVAMKLTATADINSSNADKFNMLLERKLPIWTGTSWSAPTATRSIAWTIADIWMSTYGGSNPYDKLDLDKFIELDTLWSSRGDSFDGFFDQQLGIFEAISKVARVGRAKPVILNNGILSLVRDEEILTPTAFFSTENMLKNSFSIEYNISDDDSYDGIKLKYFDEDDNYAIAYVYSDDIGASKFKEVDFFGCVNYDQAWRECQYLTAVFQLQRQRVQFDTELDGYIPLVGDLITVSHDLADWATSGYVENKNSLEITTSEPLDFSGGGTYYIEFRKKNGGVSGPHIVTQGADAYTAILQSDVTDMTFYTTVSVVERTYYAFGEANNFTKKCIITGIKAKTVTTTTIYCSPYIEAIYTADEGTIPAKPTNAPSLNPIPPDVGGLTAVNTSTTGEILVTWNPQFNIDNYEVGVSSDNLVWSTVGSPTINTFTTNTGTGNKYIRLSCVIGAQSGMYTVISIIVT